MKTLKIGHPALVAAVPDDAHSMVEQRPNYAENIGRQKSIYGVALNVLIHRITGTLGITQIRLAETIGVSPAMLSQLSGGRRVKIGDPTVVGRLFDLDQRCRTEKIRPDDIPEVLHEIATSTPRPFVARREQPPQPHCLPAAPGRGPRPANVARTTAPRAEDAFRGISPGRLAAAAREVAASFPEIAALLQRAASRPRPRRA